MISAGSRIEVSFEKDEESEPHWWGGVVGVSTDDGSCICDGYDDGVMMFHTKEEVVTKYSVDSLKLRGLKFPKDWYEMWPWLIMLERFATSGSTASAYRLACSWATEKTDFAPKNCTQRMCCPLRWPRSWSKSIATC